MARAVGKRDESESRHYSITTDQMDVYVDSHNDPTSGATDPPRPCRRRSRQTLSSATSPNKANVFAKKLSNSKHSKNYLLKGTIMSNSHELIARKRMIKKHNGMPNAAHAPDCGTAICCARYANPSPIFFCIGCERMVGFCLGSADDMPELCDDCYDHVIRVRSRAERERREQDIIAQRDRLRRASQVVVRR